MVARCKRDTTRNGTSDSRSCLIIDGGTVTVMSQLAKASLDHLLGLWISTQIYGHMPPSSRCKRDTTRKWNPRFKELLDYRSGHGDCDVPVSQGKFGLWVSTHRQAYRAGSLVQDRINRLNSIGFKWRRTEDWDIRFQELIQYKAQQLQRTAEQGPLGRWYTRAVLV